MGMIPTLKTAFCGCSNRTGSKIIGWLTLILGIVEIIVLALLLAMLSSMLSNTSDDNIGETVVDWLHKSESPDYHDFGEINKQQLRDVLKLMVGNSDQSNPAEVGKYVKQQINVILSVMFIILLVFFLLHSLITFTLLYGVYKNKSGYVLFYLVVGVIGLLGCIPAIFSGKVPFNVQLSMVIGCSLHLYFTWVVYSFYRELRDPNNYISPSSMLLHGQKHFEDATILVSKVEPNDYYFPQK